MVVIDHHNLNENVGTIDHSFFVYNNQIFNLIFLIMNDFKNDTTISFFINNNKVLEEISTLFNLAKVII